MRKESATLGSFKAAETEPVAIINSQACAISANSWLIFKVFSLPPVMALMKKGLENERSKTVVAIDTSATSICGNDWWTKRTASKSLLCSLWNAFAKETCSSFRFMIGPPGNGKHAAARG